MTSLTDSQEQGKMSEHTPGPWATSEGLKWPQKTNKMAKQKDKTIEHGPAPWRIEQRTEWREGSHPPVLEIVNDDKVVVCRLPRGGDQIIELANARLIASAPELLEACKRARRALNYDIGQSRRDALGYLNAAIAQAKGGGR